MPLANINVLAGHPRPVLQAMLREVSQTYADILDAPMDRLQVWVTEIDPGLYTVAGEPADQVMERQPRAATEIPLIRLAMMQGRPAEQIERAIRDLTAVVAKHLGSDLGRIRVEVHTVPPAQWGIGGIPAAVKRSTELAARANGA